MFEVIVSLAVGVLAIYAMLWATKELIEKGREHDPEIDACMERARATPIRGMERPDFTTMDRRGFDRWSEVQAAQERIGRKG